MGRLASECGSFCGGMGSVLRLIPGVDIILPDKQLIPGSNANNMVLQVEAEFTFPRLPPEFSDIALWLLFEYVGVATVTPGQCEVTMNPLGSGAIAETAPLQSTTATEPPSTTEGSGWLDTAKDIFGKVKQSGLIGNLASMIPGVGAVAGPVLKTLGFGSGGVKRGRSGGAQMALGDFC